MSQWLPVCRRETPAGYGLGRAPHPPAPSPGRTERKWVCPPLVPPSLFLWGPRAPCQLQIEPLRRKGNGRTTAIGMPTHVHHVLTVVLCSWWRGLLLPYGVSHQVSLLKALCWAYRTHRKKSTKSINRHARSHYPQSVSRLLFILLCISATRVTPL